MNITSDINDKNLGSLINSTITSSITITTTTTTTTLLRLFNTTRIFSFPRSSSTVSTPVLNKYFLFKSPLNRIMRIIELFILSLTLPLYAIVFILFIELTVLRIDRNTTISNGGSFRRGNEQRRHRIRSLIWTLNYLLVDFLNLLYELIYVIIHLTGDLTLNSLAGRFYCQLQIYLPLYLTVLMAYSLTAISIYRRRHFGNLNNQITRSINKSIIMIGTLWMMPIITSIIPAFLLTHLNILKIIQHESTNQCQISYKYDSTIEAIYIFYRLGNFFLLPLSISFACYLTIYVDIIRMQRRFSRVFKRHIHIRKNLISQILFLFLNFAVFWLPAEIIMLYTKNRHLKNAAQVTKSLNILLDPLIITGFDTRFSSAAQQLLLKWRFDEFMCFFHTNRQNNSSIVVQRTRTKRLKHSHQITGQQMPAVSTWNIAGNDNITVLESVSNHFPQKKTTKQKQQQRSISSSSQRQSIKRRQKRIKIVENHV